MTLLGHIGTGPAEEESASTSPKHDLLPQDETSTNPKKLKASDDADTNTLQTSEHNTGATPDTRRSPGVNRGDTTNRNAQRTNRKTHQTSKSPRRGDVARLEDHRPAKKRSAHYAPKRSMKEHLQDPRIGQVPTKANEDEEEPIETKSKRQKVSTHLPPRASPRGSSSKLPKDVQTNEGNIPQGVSTRRNANEDSRSHSNEERMAARQAKENIRNIAITSSRRGKSFVEETIIDSSLHNAAEEEDHKDYLKQTTSEETDAHNSDPTASICNKSIITNPDESSSSEDVANDGRKTQDAGTMHPFCLAGNSISTRSQAWV